jgi:hypothetical protein
MLVALGIPGGFAPLPRNILEKETGIELSVPAPTKASRVVTTPLRSSLTVYATSTFFSIFLEILIVTEPGIAPFHCF